LVFPDIKTDEDRTRIIIFATDNDVAGTETVTLEEACTLCKKYNVNLYAYCPSAEINTYTSKEKIESYKNAVEKNAGGKFYTGELEKMTSNIVNEIKETKTSLLKASKKTYVTDHPEILFIIIVIAFLVLVVFERIIKI
jgi:DNA gyrase/topoisomerase IV subunit B